MMNQIATIESNACFHYSSICTMSSTKTPLLESMPHLNCQLKSMPHLKLEKAVSLLYTLLESIEKVDSKEWHQAKDVPKNGIRSMGNEGDICS